MCREEERPRRESFTHRVLALVVLIGDRRLCGDFGPDERKVKLGPILRLFWAKNIYWANKS